MTQQFAGGSALVTGGGSGIGRATALALAAEGALVTVAGRTAETLKETVRLVEAAGGTARFVIADMTDESQVENAVQAAVEDIGRLDIAINNAGYDGEFRLTQDYSTEMLDHMIALNVRGVFLSMKHELRHMVARGLRLDREHLPAGADCRQRRNLWWARGCSAASPATRPPRPLRSR